MAVIHFAPLQGYTDSVYREAHTRVFGGVDTYYTPFVRIEKGGFRNKDLKDIACDRNRQVHVVPQLIASTPDEFLETFLLLLNKQSANRFIDLNIFCVIRHCYFALSILIYYYLLTLFFSSIISSYLSTIVLDDKLV